MNWKEATVSVSEEYARFLIKDFYIGTEGDLFCQAIACEVGVNPNN